VDFNGVVCGMYALCGSRPLFGPLIRHEILCQNILINKYPAAMPHKLLQNMGFLQVIVAFDLFHTHKGKNSDRQSIITIILDATVSIIRVDFLAVND